MIKNIPQLIIVMGVSGCGKSTIAQMLADKLSYSMMDADDFHTLEAKERMAKQLPLTDQHRLPWIDSMLDFITHEIHEKKQTKGIVLAYSGLKKLHREKFHRLNIENHFVFLQGSQCLIEDRMKNRTNHFFPAALLQTQFDALDIPDSEEKNITPYDVNLSPDDICLQVINSFMNEKRETI